MAPSNELWSLQKPPGFEVSDMPRLTLRVWIQQSSNSGMYFEIILKVSQKELS